MGIFVTPFGKKVLVCRVYSSFYVVWNDQAGV
jgi:hypothetical protein